MEKEIKCPECGSHDTIFYDLSWYCNICEHDWEETETSIYDVIKPK